MNLDFELDMADKEKRFLRLDFNLLMSGTWVLTEKEAKLNLFEKELNGGKVVISSIYGVPRVKDSKLLDYLMMTSQEQNWSKVIEFPSLNHLAKTLKFSTKDNFKELKQSLRLLKRLTIEFHNCFIDTGVLEHFKGMSEIVEIGVLQGYQIKKTKRGKSYPVKIVFDDNFLALCKYSLGYKLIPYAPINGLRDTAYALYKWAWRWFNAKKGYGERWIGDGKKLVEWYKNELNSTANYKYPSKVLERIRSAIKQLNEHNQVPFVLELHEENGNYKIEIHRKDLCTLKREIPFDRLPKFLRDAAIRLIEKKKHIKEPYALARSMSWRELEELLKKVLVVPIHEKTWSFIEFSLENMENEKEKKELQETILSHEKKDNGEVFLTVEKARFKKGNALYNLLDMFSPNWRNLVHEGVGYLKEEKMVSEVEN